MLPFLDLSDEKQAVVRSTWTAAAGLLHGLPVERSRLLLPLLALQSKLSP